MPSLLPFRKPASARNNESVDDSGSTQPNVGAERKKGSLRRMFGKKPSKKGSSATADSIQIEDVATKETIVRVESPPPLVVEEQEQTILTPATTKPKIDLSDHTSSPTISSDVSIGSVESTGLCQQPVAKVTQEEPKVAESQAACYLVYETDSSGRLVEHYSLTPVEGAVGRWVAGGDKTIAKFKIARNAGRNVLIGSCSAGVQGRKNYCNGWCQFVKSAKIMKGEVQLWDPTGKGMMVDVYLYRDDKRSSHQTIRLEQGIAYSTDNVLAVACIPKNTTFFEGMAVDMLKWLSDARDHGYSTEI